MDQPPSSFIGITSTGFGNGLSDIMEAGDIRPGDEPSYQLCKALYTLHPLGAKLAEAPIRLAQSQEREISVPDSPEEDVVDAFLTEWKNLEATRIIFNVRVQSRVYGLASVALGTRKTNADQPVDLGKLWEEEVYFNVLDPLNTSGLIVDQNPNSPTFQKHGDLTVAGQRYHRSRTLTILNEEPIYIAWTTSAFSYAGRSVYQRTLYPLKSFLETMRTDDMIVRKAGVLVAKMEAPGTIIDQVMRGIYALKRQFLKQASTNNVLSIGLKESIETLNMQNLDGPMKLARDDIVKNIASGAGMSAKLLDEEAFVEGFGEGTEDAKRIAQDVDRERIELAPVYSWFDNLTMHRAWNPKFYETIQARFPDEYGDVDYKTAFYRWKNSYKAEWPSLLKEPPSEQVQVDDVKLKAMIAVVQVFAPLIDPVNKVELLSWACDNLNAHELIFAGAKLTLDLDELLDFLKDQKTQQEQAGLEQAENASPNKPFSGHDSADVAAWLGSRAEMPKHRLVLAR